ncbi:MAG: glycosyltransferase family 4 protein [Bacteroidales bacterium]|nr:glycosyltransferase family 4 protein [Bacteroidales bacterium]
MSEKNPQILFIAPLPPPVHGSAMVSRQIKESKVINDSYRCDFVNLSTSRRMDEIGKTTPAKLWRFASSYFKVLGKLLTRRYDLCYLAITCHGAGFLKDAPYVLLCKLFRRKIVIHQHNKGMSDDVDRPLYKWLLPSVYRNADVILLSQYLYPDIEKVVKKEQVMICPNGIAAKEGIPVFDHQNTVTRILFLSNLMESKGVFVLLDACKILKDKGYSFKCDLVGGETKEIDATRFNEEVQKRGLDGIVVYHGRKYGADKEEYLQNSDIFVLPTSNDCFPLVLLEAMQNGLPCVSTPIGGIPDIIADGETGLLCESKKPSALAESLEKLLADKSLRVMMGESGLRRYKEKFTETAFERNFIGCLDKSIKRS